MDLWQGFEQWHDANPHVWLMFIRFTAEVAKTGRTRYSARDIIHRIRWHTNFEMKAVDEFKINDHWSPYYARALAIIYPKMSGFFEMRKVGEGDPALVERVVRRLRFEAAIARTRKQLRDQALR